MSRFNGELVTLVDDALKRGDAPRDIFVALLGLAAHIFKGSARARGVAPDGDVYLKAAEAVYGPLERQSNDERDVRDD